jgi:hypothetical protein
MRACWNHVAREYENGNGSCHGDDDPGGSERLIEDESESPNGSLVEESGEGGGTHDASDQWRHSCCMGIEHLGSSDCWEIGG